MELKLGETIEVTQELIDLQEKANQADNYCAENEQLRTELKTEKEKSQNIEVTLNTEKGKNAQLFELLKINNAGGNIGSININETIKKLKF